MKAISVILLSLLALSCVDAHIRLSFPKARMYDLDFLDNVRTRSPCGMPENATGNGVYKTKLMSGSTIDVTWHMAFPHGGGFRVQILHRNGTVAHELTPTSSSTPWYSVNNNTVQNYMAMLPNGFMCDHCILRLTRNAKEWVTNNGAYIFWSCADVEIKNFGCTQLDCYHGGSMPSNCNNASPSCTCSNNMATGDRCQYMNECANDADCNNNGKCITINQDFYYPIKQCYCSAGSYGYKCAKSTTLTQVMPSDTTSYTYTRLNSDSEIWYKILSASSEVEVIHKTTTKSWAALGWRPQGLRSSCQFFPAGAASGLLSGPGGSAEGEGEGKPEGNAEGTGKPEGNAEGTSKPEGNAEGTAAPEGNAEGTSKPEGNAEGTSKPEGNAEGTSKPEGNAEGTSKPEGNAEGTSKPEGEGEGGSSENGGAGGAVAHPMDCMDMVIGSARGNTFRLFDYYSRDRSTPRMDAFFSGMDSVTAAVGSEVNGITTLRWRKKLAAEGQSDHSITDALMDVIYAHGQKHPYSHQFTSGLANSERMNNYYGDDELKYHGFQNRGRKTLNFYGGNRLTTGQCSGSWGVGCAAGKCANNLMWNVYNDGTVHFSMSAKTDKWIALGISDNTKMDQTDAIVGWVNGGKAVIKDRYVRSYAPPAVDAIGNVFLVNGSLTNGVTSLNFYRKINTTDTQNDITLHGCHYFIFAIGGNYNQATYAMSKHASTPFVTVRKVCIDGGLCTTSKPPSTGGAPSVFTMTHLLVTIFGVLVAKLF